jgi:threonyl-tRNA synthetase
MDFKLPDGTTLSLPDGATGADAAAAIGPGLAKAALAVKVDGEVRDLARPLPGGDGATPQLEVITERSGEDALALIRHDAPDRGRLLLRLRFPRRDPRKRRRL